MTERLFGRGRRGGVLLIAGAVLGAVIAGPGAVVAQKAMDLTTTTGDKRYVKRGETIAAGKTVEAKIDKFTNSSFSPVATAKINAPAAGWLVVNASISAKDDSTTAGDGKLQYRLAVNDTPLSTLPESFELFLSDLTDGRENGSVNGVFRVTGKGQLKVHLQAQEVAPGTGSTILGRSLSVQFVPKGKLPKTSKKNKKKKPKEPAPTE